MSLVRVDNQTGRIGPGGLAASVGVGGTFDLGAAWTGPTTVGGEEVKIVCEPPLLGGPSPRYEVVYAEVTHGSAIATVTQRQAEGSGRFDHPVSSLWTHTATAQDIVSTQGQTTFIWNQGTPAAVWHILHNLNRQPSIELIDSTGDEVEADIFYINSNQIDAVFVGATAGFAYLN